MRTAITLNSGGLDSLAALIWAKQNFDDVVSVAINYGQRNWAELRAASRIADNMQCIAHTEVDFRALGTLNPTALSAGSTAQLDLPRVAGIAPNVIVPARNLIFLSIAASLLPKYNAKDIVCGFGGRVAPTPDQQEAFARAFEATLRAGGIDDRLLPQDNVRIGLHTPLMQMTKGDVITYIHRSLNFAWIHDTVTCYDGVPGGCGVCLACKARAHGFAEADITDPILVARGQREEIAF